MNPTNKIIVAAYHRWRHIFYIAALKNQDRDIDINRMRLIMDAYRRLNKIVLAMACQCEADDIARSTRGCDNEDLNNVGIYVCQQLMEIAGATELPKDWNPAVPESWARQLGL